MIRLLLVEDIILLHTKLIKKTGGRQGIRDKGLIESATARALATFGGNDLYKTLDEKIEIEFIDNGHGILITGHVYLINKSIAEISAGLDVLRIYLL